MTWNQKKQIFREVRLAQRPAGRPSLSNFEIAQVTFDEPHEGEVFVENLFMSVDPYMRGRLDDRPSYIPPFEIGEPLDGAAVGRVLLSRSSALAEGDYVLHRYGWRERVVAPARKFQKIDSSLAPLQAYLGALGMTGLTAYIGLLDIGAVKESDTVFVSAAAGAVGSIAVQIARIKGCTVIGSAGSPEKVAWLTEVARVTGAFDYKTTESLTRTLRDLAPKGIDVYFDNVGGAQLEAALAVMNTRGRIVLCGMIGQYNATEPTCAPRNLAVAIGKRITLRGFIVSDHDDRRDAFVADMGRWLADGQIRCEETISDGIESAPAAFIGLLDGKNTGKMLVRLATE